ncbi:MAG: 3-dehydroquinate synthase, partial [Steroidobacteraceae bacterium]
LGDGALLRARVPGRDVLLVSNTIVAPLYAQALAGSLGDRRIVEVVLPDGESHKTLPTVSRILDVLVANRFGRDCTLVALGGGVVGDMAGFAAACYQRSVRYVQVPTTLLAQVDSSVGGKTGVNHPGGKNLIGAFHQPAAVIADTATLGTLPDRELRAGLAEVIKYGLIRDAAFFTWLEASMDRLLARDAEALASAIRRSCEIKATIVARDEREQGERALLNLGHTFGHAIESATGYASWLHGEAVGTGLLMAAAMSQECGTMGAEQVERVRALLERTGLPVSARDVPAGAALSHMRIDKKVKAGRIRLVLLQGIGDSYVTGDYSDERLRKTVEAHCA